MGRAPFEVMKKLDIAELERGYSGIAVTADR
jgi:hypothetical protein